MKRLLLIPILFLAGLASAQIVDQFTYTGALNANGWTNHNGTAGQFQSDNVGSLTYAGLAPSAGFKASFVSGNSEDINKAVTGISGTGYYSLLINVPNTTGLGAAGEYFMGFAKQTGSTGVSNFAGRLYIKTGSVAGTFNLGIANYSGGTITPSYSTVDHPIGTAVFVVVSVNTAAVPYVANLFVNPTPGSAEPTPTATNSVGTGSDFTTFASIFLRQAATTGNTQIDEIRAGSTWASVTPAGVVTCTNTTATIDTVSCAASYTVPSGDETYMTNGTYMDTIPNANNCDSILTINLSFVASINYYPDTDGDGFGDNSAVAVPACTPPTDHVTNNNDCDDTNPAIGVAVMYYVDADIDGYGDATATGVPSCTMIPGSVTNHTDCNDGNAAIHPGATEIPNNGIDEDCNGSDLVVVATPMATYEFTGNTCPLPAVSATVSQPNVSFGGYGATGPSLLCVTTNDVINHSGFNTTSTVNTAEYMNFTVFPDICFGLDLNRIIFTHKTSGTGLTPTVHLRSSLDNFAADIATKTLPNSTAKTDTIDLPAAFDNLTSVVEFRWYITQIGAATATYRHDDVKVYGTTNALPTQTYYADTDGDGFGDPAAPQTACSAPANHVLDNTDCDDTDEEEFPGAVWYADTDGDGLGDAGSSQVSCTRPMNHVSNDTDCNDNNNQIGGEQMYYEDADIDGFGDANDPGTASCAPIAGSVTNNTDCDDDDEDVNPNATEVCDGIDNNCDGNTDEGFTMVTYYEDADNDTYGNPASTVQDCVQPAGFVTNDDDCNDTIAAIHPGAVDFAGNGVDENCDGTDGMLGIEETILANLNVYPNPGTSSVVLNMNNGWNGFQVTFAAVDGKEISLTSVQKSANELEFNTDSLVSGVYFIRLTSTEGTALVRWVKK